MPHLQIFYCTIFSIGHRATSDVFEASVGTGSSPSRATLLCGYKDCDFTSKYLSNLSRHRRWRNHFITDEVRRKKETNDTLEFSPLANLETKHHVQNPKRLRNNSNSDLEFASRSKMSRHKVSKIFKESAISA